VPGRHSTPVSVVEAGVVCRPGHPDGWDAAVPAQQRTWRADPRTVSTPWQPRPRLPWRRRRQQGADTELSALRAQLQALRSAATDLVGSDDLDTVLDRIVARAAEAVPAPAHVLAVHAPAGGPPLVHSAGLTVAEAQDVAAELLAGREPGTRAVVVDVASARRRHGRLAAVHRAEVHGTVEESAVLSACAGHAAAALDLLMAVEEARSQAARSAALLELAHELAGSVGIDEVCDVVARALPRVVGCTSAAVLSWDPSDGCLRVRSSRGLPGERQERLSEVALRPEDVPEVVGMLTDRKPQVLDADRVSPVLRTLLDTLGLSDVVAVPLLADGAFLGVVTASWQRGEAPAPPAGDVLARLRGVGDQAATALQKARLLEAVQHQARHDGLTGLPNRGLVLQQLEASLEMAGPDAPLALLFCDLDRFKAVNERLGHAAGDELLRQVAARLRAVVRPGDTVGRLSGDEFVLLLPDVRDLRHAESLAERVAGCFTEPFRLTGSPASVRASIGLALHSEPDDDCRGEQLLSQADAAMHRAKHGARRSGGRRTRDLPR
jgi:diguanylate cyclase (GGDEF)-like protein